ncbi:hypothetical protein HDK90DRAFT_313478 [Phyllosticta capitalensis]|uniref:Uncharacterized protein n=1 Tax=Phyllosticta capitalensis TaxID=121624 RepID=A0ABR1YL62_9PEZI
MDICTAVRCCSGATYLLTCLPTSQSVRSTPHMRLLIGRHGDRWQPSHWTRPCRLGCRTGRTQYMAIAHLARPDHAGGVYLRFTLLAEPWRWMATLNGGWVVVSAFLYVHPYICRARRGGGGSQQNVQLTCTSAPGRLAARERARGSAAQPSPALLGAASQYLATRCDSSALVDWCGRVVELLDGLIAVRIGARKEEEARPLLRAHNYVTAPAR